MTRDYISIGLAASIDDAIAALRNFESDQEVLTHIFLVDEQGVLRAVVPLVKVLLAPRDAVLETLAEDHIVSCELHASAKKVAELFDKYNLRALPVLDKDRKLVGVIYAEQVIAQLRNG